MKARRQLFGFWQNHGEDASLPQFAPNLDPSAVRFHQLLDYGKTQAHPTAGTSIETLEDEGEFVRCNAAAGILAKFVALSGFSPLRIGSLGYI